MKVVHINPHYLHSAPYRPSYAIMFDKRPEAALKFSERYPTTFVFVFLTRPILMTALWMHEYSAYAGDDRYDHILQPFYIANIVPTERGAMIRRYIEWTMEPYKLANMDEHEIINE